MIRQVLESQCGILFNNLPATTSILDHIQLDDDSPGKQIDAVDAVDALQPIHDDIHPCSVWWIPEMIPRMFRAQDAQGHWRQWFGCVFSCGICHLADPGSQVELGKRAKDRRTKPKLSRLCQNTYG